MSHEHDTKEITLEGVSEKPNLTVELETADLKSLAQEGFIQPMTMELSTTDLTEIQPGNTVAELGRIVGESSNVIVDLSDPAAAPNLAPRAPTNAPAKPQADLSSLLPTPAAPTLGTPRSIAIPRAPSSARAQTAELVEQEAGGAWLVVVVYLVAIVALGVSVYLRFFI